MGIQTVGRTVAYGRVSSREQQENQHAAEQQCARLRAKDIDELFFDVESGDSQTRLEFNRMMSLVHKQDIGKIIATRWDRLTRNQETYLQLKLVLQDLKVQLFLLDQGEVDLTTASGELSADMQAIFATHERRMLRERILRGMSIDARKKSPGPVPPLATPLKMIGMC